MNESDKLMYVLLMFLGTILILSLIKFLIDLKNK